MKATVQKWGNSLGIRFPKVYADETGISNGSKVEISVSKGRFIIEPIRKNEKSLDELLSHITKDNIHAEIETNKEGEEIW